MLRGYVSEYLSYRDNSCTTSDRFVNWTAASETYQRKSNIFIIQQNKINVKDRSFSRKIESEWSFFVFEIYLIRWISSEINSMYSRKAILWRRYGMWR